MLKKKISYMVVGLCLLLMTSAPTMAANEVPININTLINNLPISPEGKMFLNIYKDMVRIVARITGMELPDFFK